MRKSRPGDGGQIRSAGAAQPELDATRLLRAVKLMVRRFAVTERADVSCCGLTVAQAATLETLESVGPLRLGELGKRLGVQPSTLTRNLARLEEGGLVLRESDPGDARAFRVRLSAAGRRAASRVALQELDFARAILDELPGERRLDALSGLEDLLQAVVRATRRCCPGAFDHLMESDERDASRGSDCNERC